MRADLPVVYRRSAAYFASFVYPARDLGLLLPHPTLRPAMWLPGKAVLVVGFLEHQDTSIGPYNEAFVGILCHTRRSAPVPLLSVLVPRFIEDVGIWCHTQVTSSEAATEVARSAWGFPAITGEVNISRDAPDGGRVVCDVTKDGAALLHVEIEKPGASAPDAFPQRFYSAIGEELLFTEMHVDATESTSRWTPRAKLSLADHVRWHDLDRGAAERGRPLRVRWCDEYRTLADRPLMRYRMSA